VELEYGLWFELKREGCFITQVLLALEKEWGFWFCNNVKKMGKEEVRISPRVR
jgi:hypothetical protein